MARQYFWLYGKPIYWSIKDMKIGEEEEFTLYNSSGNKRRIFNCFVNAREGDLVVGYQSAPVAQIIALFRVSHEVENPDDINATIGFEKLLDIPEGITKQDLIDRGLGDISPMRNNQGSIFPLSEEEYQTILGIIEDNNPGIFDGNEERFGKGLGSRRKSESRGKYTNKTLDAKTKIMSAFKKDELLEILGIDELVPRVYPDDSTVILFEGDRLSFDWQSSAEVLIHYELSLFGMLRRDFDLRRDLEIPETVLIMNKESEAIYRFMGQADLEIINTEHKKAADGSYDYTVTLKGTIMFEDKSEFDVDELKEKFGDLDPKTIEQVIATFRRDPKVAEYAKKSAKGICQLCGKPAPFIDKNGEPYLESHHVIWLSRGGTDTIDNVVGLCPNCHSKVHAIDDPIDIGTMLMAISDRENQK